MVCGITSWKPEVRVNINEYVQHELKHDSELHRRYTNSSNLGSYHMKSQLYLLYIFAIVVPTVIGGQFWLGTNPTNSSCYVSSVSAAERYNGTKYNTGTQTRLRIANGGGMY